ncbi:hypothetical protein ACHAWF_001656 [Thalassiosira exigua]
MRRPLRIALGLLAGYGVYFANTSARPPTAEDGDPRSDEIGRAIPDANATEGIFVVSMQGTPGVDKRNARRLDAFKRKWKEKCGTVPEIRHCPGVYHPRRGFGVTTSFYFCLIEAQERDLDVTVVFEDDARLEAKAAAFCDGEHRRRELYSNLPDDTFVAHLGGHGWIYQNDPGGEADRQDGTDSPYRFRPSSKSYGAYGYVVPRKSLRHLLEMFEFDLVNGMVHWNGTHKTHGSVSPEYSFYRYAELRGETVYAVDPLVVWHEGGFSNTWGNQRNEIRGNVVGKGEGWG